MIEKLIPTIERVGKYQKEKYASATLDFSTKDNDLDFVSEVDTGSQKMIVAGIEKYFPHAGILAEEEGLDKPPTHGSCWFVVDPLDGTASFKSKLGMWAISVGLIVDGKITEGIVACPFTGDILCSTDAVAPTRLASRLEEVRFYGIDSAFQEVRLPELKAKRRQFGVAVLTNLLCCKTAFGGSPCLDLVLAGKSMFWDIAGVAAILKNIGGALIDSHGRDLTKTDNLIEELGGTKVVRKTKITYVASASAVLAHAVFDAGYLGR